MGAWVDIPFNAPISLFSGYAYEFGIVGFQHAKDNSFIVVSGPMMYAGEHSSYDEFGLSSQSAGTPTWYYITSCPMVRMNFAPASAAPSWDCDNGACYDPGTGNGQYSNITDCEAACTHVVINEFSTADFNLYPNPAKSHCIITSIKKIKICFIFRLENN